MAAIVSICLSMPAPVTTRARSPKTRTIPSPRGRPPDGEGDQRPGPHNSRKGGGGSIRRISTQGAITIYKLRDISTPAHVGGADDRVPRLDRDRLGKRVVRDAPRARRAAAGDGHAERPVQRSFGSAITSALLRESSSRQASARAALCGVTTTNRVPAASISGKASTTRRR